MKDLSRKSKKLILNILESELKKNRKLLKKCQSDKNCNLETYENIVDKFSQLGAKIKRVN